MNRPQSPLTIFTVIAMACITFGISMLIVFLTILQPHVKATRGLDVPAIERFESFSATPPKYK